MGSILARCLAFFLLRRCSITEYCSKMNALPLINQQVCGEVVNFICELVIKIQSVLGWCVQVKTLEHEILQLIDRFCSTTVDDNDK